MRTLQILVLELWEYGFLLTEIWKDSRIAFDESGLLTVKTTTEGASHDIGQS